MATLRKGTPEWFSSQKATVMATDEYDASFVDFCSEVYVQLKHGLSHYHPLFEGWVCSNFLADFVTDTFATAFPVLYGLFKLVAIRECKKKNNGVTPETVTCLVISHERIRLTKIIFGKIYTMLDDYIFQFFLFFWQFNNLKAWLYDVLYITVVQITFN